MNFDDYQTGAFHDEMFLDAGSPRAGAEVLFNRLRTLPFDELLSRQAAAEKAFFDLGITFAVYGDERGAEKIFPFDIIPRIFEAAEWERVESGLQQRIQALNLFLADVYGEQRILKDGIVPRQVVESCPGFYPECMGLEPHGGVWCHITGTDLIRDRDGSLHVLEDNLQSPSGASYVMANRMVMKRTFPQVFAESRVRSVENYPSLLLDMLHAVAPEVGGKPTVALLTPGIYNSAYFEHSFLAQQTGITLVEGNDLVVHDGYVHMRTTTGLIRVDVIYRRISEAFIDPTVFRPDSMLGVPGIMDVYRNGRVTLANAPGTGVADDKAIYAYVPAIIRYYLDQEPLLPNVETFLCRDPKHLSHVLENLDKMVVKATNESGGYGMLIGPASTREQQEEFAAKLRQRPEGFIAQPTISLSCSPVIVDDHFEPRHVDFRPYILYGKSINVVPGGLTRVALRRGSLVVNSSQGGGSKDTWVLRPR